MKSHTYYLRSMSSGWNLYDLSERSADETPSPIATALDQQAVVNHLAERIKASGQAASARLVLGLPASWCLCATVSDEGLPRSTATQHAEALGYRLEGLLPITAEACAIDYMGPGPERIGIALECDRIKALIHALEDAGHTVEAITPRSLLAGQAWLQLQNPSSGDTLVSLCWLEDNDTSDTGSCQLIHFDPEGPSRWRVFDTGADAQAALRQQLEIDGVASSTTDRDWRAAAAVSTALAGAADQAIQPDPLSDALDAELDAARAIVNGAAQPWINLARGPLAPRYHWRRLRVPAVAMVAALVMLLVAIGSVLLLRADAYEQVAEDYDTQSAEVFVQAQPGQDAPRSPKRRLQSRLKQLRGESGLAGGDTLEHASRPTLLLLYDLLDALPSDQRYAITDLRIEDGQLRMTGYARTHSEADQIAKTLRASSVFIVEPPSTDNLREGGVRFALQAKHHQPDVTKDHVEQTPPQTPSETPSLAERTQQGGER